MPRHKICLGILPSFSPHLYAMLHTCHDEFTPSHCYSHMYFRVCTRLSWWMRGIWQSSVVCNTSHILHVAVAETSQPKHVAAGCVDGRVKDHYRHEPRRHALRLPKRC